MTANEKPSLPVGFSQNPIEQYASGAERKVVRIMEHKEAWGVVSWLDDWRARQTCKLGAEIAHGSLDEIDQSLISGSWSYFSAAYRSSIGTINFS